MTTPEAETGPALEELRLAALLRQAPLEFARVVYGLNDRANGRAGTMAAEDVARTVRQGTPVTRERAEQRARGYLPLAGQEHCPRCWVFNGVKSPLALPRGHRGTPRVGGLQGVRRRVRHRAGLTALSGQGKPWRGAAKPLPRMVRAPWRETTRSP